MAGAHNTIPSRGQIRALEQEKANTIAAAMVTRVGNTRAKVSPLHKTTVSTHLRNKVTSSRCLVTLVECPPFPLLPPPLASVMMQNVNFTRCSCSKLVQRPAPTSLVSCLACRVAQHVIPYIRSTQRRSHTYFCEESTGSFAACYEVSRRYAGDESLRLERRSSQPRHGSLRFTRRSIGNGSLRFGRRSPQLRRYSGDGSLRLGRRSSQPRHGGLRTRRRSPQPRAAQ